MADLRHRLFFLPVLHRPVELTRSSVNGCQEMALCVSSAFTTAMTGIVDACYYSLKICTALDGLNRPFYFVFRVRWKVWLSEIFKAVKILNGFKRFFFYRLSFIQVTTNLQTKPKVSRKIEKFC